MGLLGHRTSARKFEALSIKPQVLVQESSKKLRGSRRLKKIRNGESQDDSTRSTSNVTEPHLLAQESNQLSLLAFILHAVSLRVDFHT